MTLRQFKASYYAMTAVSTVATSYYFNYLFFHLHDRFGFGNRQNLRVAAFHGSLYVFAAWWGGRFAERRGYHVSLLCGFTGLFLCMLAALSLDSIGGQMATVAAYTFVLLLIWPAMEALVTEHEPASRVPHMVGLYNMTWSSATAVAYFTGGSVYDAFGRSVLVTLAAVAFAGQGLLLLWLPARAARVVLPASVDVEKAVRHPEARAFTQRVPPRVFLRLAWIANPFAYMAMYTVFAVMPDLAHRLGLSPTRVGLFCSVWLFSRVIAFGCLWHWTGWHYRFRWMIGAFLLVIAGFAAILLANALWVIVVAQVFFGLGAGLIYYSSLFYAMDVGETKGEHGGLHEAAIGIGICAGPAVGALSLELFPQVPAASAIAVSALLATGCAALVVTWGRARAAVHSS